MEYRLIGKTGLRVSALGYGASPLGSVFRPIDEAEGIRTVHLAIDLGINFIDVSPYYGLTRAEAVLGKALATIPRDRYTWQPRWAAMGRIASISPHRGSPPVWMRASAVWVSIT